ncbi:DUF2304 domain-containing protein [Cohnella sp. LGH]|uniref:DUF2304 domain-containing protein n=1 Tax=Cohnella sp. LGH TaxID=1619153 RepID=UPI001ADD2603|nr:DUF2304 domain-containing protein [Cohnella sp. LGH]QTH42330.1 DUF2304 domain-containing protein [Cohnella sp. LGH]
MISFKLHIILIGTSAIGFLFIVNLIRKYKLELKYSLLWILLSLSILIIGLFPDITITLSDLLGIEMPVNTIFLIAHACSIAIVFSLTIALSRLSMKMKDVVQEVGIMKREIYELKAQLNAGKGRP